MSETKPRREQNIPVWGTFLLFLGTVFLLQNLHVIPWGLWGTLWRFWPVLIIIAGFTIILRGYNPWLVSLAILALLFACLGIAIWQYEPVPTIPETTNQIYTQAPDSTAPTCLDAVNMAKGIYLNSPTNSWGYI